MRDRTLRFIAALALFISGALAVANPASAAPATPGITAAQFGFNPSGKVDANGQPLHRPHAGAPQAGAHALSQQLTTPTPECPPALMSKCSFQPAAYQNNNPADPSDYGNYDKANRPADGNKITGVVIHDIEGTCEAAVAAFQDPLYYVSAHYVICADGRVIQMVRNEDIAWQAGNFGVNMETIGIEHAGHSARGTTEYTSAMYASDFLLVQWLAQTYQFPAKRPSIVGHDNVPPTRDSGVATQHTDPGPFWNWQNQLAALGAFPTGQYNPPAKKNSLITIAPTWGASKQVVTGCNVSNEVPPPCVPAGGPYNTNFVYMRTQPSDTAPLITDAITGPGSTEIENDAARAFYGETFGVIKYQYDWKDGYWYQVWFNGQAAWFHSPWSAMTAVAAKGDCVTPLPEQASVSLYGRAVPELSEYPADLNAPAGSIPSPTAMSYTIPYGQCYARTGTSQAKWYYAWTYGARLPYDHTVFTGAKQYDRIWYNNRYYYVPANLVRPATVG